MFSLEMFDKKSFLCLQDTESNLFHGLWCSYCFVYIFKCLEIIDAVMSDQKKDKSQKKEKKTGKTQSEASGARGKETAGRTKEWVHQANLVMQYSCTMYKWLFEKEGLNTVQFERPHFMSLTAPLALCRASKSKDSKMTSLENRWKTPTSWVRT